ncbi:hypothetical protein BN946_scf184943.g8 [Trametes cinnabarina]|uniref:Uncharacterized protein n=1 Tax=Pycnoporus cinnabarinus TaxID=5643 RepID=A0A060SIC3_PYCCI|nr:hypothetical protein BN946_scf184943.g8 [Trametes cinnabarina]
MTVETTPQDVMLAAPPPSDHIDPFSLENWRAYTRASRTGEDEEKARTLLERWRYSTWLTLYFHQPFGPSGILPNSLILTLASHTTFSTVNDLKGRWLLADRHGADVLKVLHNLDQEHTLPRIEETRAKAEATMAEREEREREHAEKVAEREREKEVREHERAERAAEKAAEREREKKAKQAA